MVKAVLSRYEREKLSPDQQSDLLIKKFKRLVKSAAIIEECRKREFHKSKSEKRREKSKAAMIRRKQAQKKAERYYNR